MQPAGDQQQKINVSEDAVDDDDNITEQANEQAEAAREHDRKTEVEYNSDEQAHAASVTEHSEEQQTAERQQHESAEQAATTVTEVDNQARQDTARAPGPTGEVMTVCP